MLFRSSREIDPPGRRIPHETKPEVPPIVQPIVKLYDTANSTNDIYYEINAFHDEIASWGFHDDVAPVVATETNHYFNSSGKLLSTDVVPITAPTATPLDTYDKSIFFPTILQEEEGYKSITQKNTNIPSPLKNAHEGDEWTSFDVNPFASNTGSGQQDRLLSFSLSPIQQPRPNDSASEDQPHHRVHEVLSSTTSQDNGSVSSPASVVQFLQMVDRCPSNKSDTNNACPFETKCSF